ncbi:hypothetical protein RF11_01667 [Thelohanellus kitauei]|uniref:Uncharacterized protein n=1 Tax=Thelohanellus kitauei TaxID=669202 RepID=A0A0C2MJY4_THEKT|nr:hypothetical protein RF11_01667 [Thelohanellus kitauei]
MFVEEIELYSLIIRWDSTFNKALLLLCMPISHRNMVKKDDKEYEAYRTTTIEVIIENRMRSRFFRRYHSGYNHKGQSSYMFYDELKIDLKSTTPNLSDENIEYICVENLIQSLLQREKSAACLTREEWLDSRIKFYKAGSTSLRKEILFAMLTKNHMIKFIKCTGFYIK